MRYTPSKNTPSQDDLRVMEETLRMMSELIDAIVALDREGLIEVSEEDGVFGYVYQDHVFEAVQVKLSDGPATRVILDVVAAEREASLLA